MGQSNQSSSALGVIILAVIIAVGLMCLIGVVVLAGFLFFGVSYRAGPTYYASPSQATLAPAPVVSATPLPNPQYPVLPTLAPGPVPINTTIIPANSFAATISVGADGEIVLDGEKLDMDQLIERLDADGQTARVTMKVHPDATFGKIEGIRKRLQQAGHTMILELDQEEAVSELE